MEPYSQLFLCTFGIRDAVRISDKSNRARVFTTCSRILLQSLQRLKGFLIPHVYLHNHTYCKYNIRRVCILVTRPAPWEGPPAGMVHVAGQKKQSVQSTDFTQDSNLLIMFEQQSILNNYWTKAIKRARMQYMHV